MRDGLCSTCAPLTAGGKERAPGRCTRCGFFFDRYGVTILEPWRTCRVHVEPLASCPHSGAIK
jgi:hypothetical protein